MTSRKKQFIAGAVCPSCSDMDSLVLYTDDQSVECVSCDYTQTSEQRDQESQKSDSVAEQKQLNKKPAAKNVAPKNTKYKDASLINITEIKE